jgi:hypothetical protein
MPRYFIHSAALAICEVVSGFVNIILWTTIWGIERGIDCATAMRVTSAIKLASTRLVYTRRMETNLPRGQTYLLTQLRGGHC